MRGNTPILFSAPYHSMNQYAYLNQIKIERDEEDDQVTFIDRIVQFFRTETAWLDINMGSIRPFLSWNDFFPIYDRLLLSPDTNCHIDGLNKYVHAQLLKDISQNSYLQPVSQCARYFPPSPSSLSAYLVSQFSMATFDELMTSVILPLRTYSGKVRTNSDNSPQFDVKNMTVVRFMSKLQFDITGDADRTPVFNVLGQMTRAILQYGKRDMYYVAGGNSLLLTQLQFGFRSASALLPQRPIQTTELLAMGGESILILTSFDLNTTLGITNIDIFSASLPPSVQVVVWEVDYDKHKLFTATRHGLSFYHFRGYTNEILSRFLSDDNAALLG